MSSSDTEVPFDFSAWRRSSSMDPFATILPLSRTRQRVDILDTIGTFCSTTTVREPFVAIDLLDVVGDLLHEHGHDPVRGFVQEQDLGFGHHGPRDREHLLLSAAHRAGPLLGPLSARRGK